MMFLFLLVLSFPTFALTTLESSIQEHVPPIISKVESLVEQNKNATYQLKRFDLDLSVGAGLGVLVFSKEVEKAIELVWERKKITTASDSEDDVEEVDLGFTAEETAQNILPHVVQVLGDLNASNRVKRSVIKKVYSDARKLTKYVKALQTFNGTESWYVANYFKNYYFSASGEILGNGVSYDKRLRFRFRTPAPSVLPRVGRIYERRLHRRLRKMARHFAAVQSLDRPEHRFSMNRVRSVDGLDGSLDFGVGEVSAGKGILLEWLPMPQQGLWSNGSVMYPPVYLRSVVSTLESFVPNTKNFNLSQIRVKGAIESEVSVIFMSFSKFREIEYHYRMKL